MSDPMLEEIRDIASRIRDLEDDLEDAINDARDVGYTAAQIDAVMKARQ